MKLPILTIEKHGKKTKLFLSGHELQCVTKYNLSENATDKCALLTVTLEVSKEIACRTATDE